MTTTPNYTIGADAAGLVADLSHYQTSVDLAAMKTGGIAAVILKASEGTTFTDPIFSSRAQAAAAAGLLVGAYHFFDPTADPTAQAAYFLGIATAAKVSVLAVDFEPATAGANEANASTMCQVIYDQTGRWPLLYTGKWSVQPANSIFSQMPLWLAEWTTSATPNLPPGFSAWQMWQFESALNTVPGVVGDCSRTRFNGALADLQRWWNPPPLPPPPPPPVDVVLTTIAESSGDTVQIIQRKIAAVATTTSLLILIAGALLSSALSSCSKPPQQIAIAHKESFWEVNPPSFRIVPTNTGFAVESLEKR